MAFERRHRVLRIIGKGNKPALIPLVPRTGRTIDLAVGGDATAQSCYATTGNAWTAGPRIAGSARSARAGSV